MIKSMTDAFSGCKLIGPSLLMCKWMLNETTPSQAGCGEAQVEEMA